MNLRLWPSSQHQSTLCWIQLRMTLLLLTSPCGKSCICRRLSPNWFSVPRKTQHPRAGWYARSEEVDSTTGSHYPYRTLRFRQLSVKGFSLPSLSSISLTVAHTIVLKCDHSLYRPCAKPNPLASVPLLPSKQFGDLFSSSQPFQWHGHGEYSWGFHTEQQLYSSSTPPPWFVAPWCLTLQGNKKP